MRTLIALALLAAQTAIGATYYVNTNWGTILTPGQQTTVVPTSLQNADGSTTYNPSQSQLLAAGWRQLNSIQQPAAGYTVLSYLITQTNLAYGLAAAWINTQTNTQWQIDASITNSPLWTANLVTEAQTYRTILQRYAGAGAHTNAAVTLQVVYGYWAPRAQTMTLSNAVDIMFIGNVLQDMRPFCIDGTVASFPWRLVP